MGLAENLKNARISKGLTQQQVADALGITKSTYSGYELGRREPDAIKLTKLSRLLGTSGDVLLETGLGEDANKKIPQTPSKKATEGMSAEDILLRFARSAGLLNDNQDLSDDDFEMLKNVISILEVWFRQKKEESS